MSARKPFVLLLILVSIFVGFQVFTFYGLNSKLLSLTKEQTWESMQDNEESIVISHETNEQEIIQPISKTPVKIESTPVPKKPEVVTSAVVEKQKSLHYPGNKKTALVIVAYNRPEYLRRTFNSIITTLSSVNNNVLVDIVLSQDGYLDVLNNVIKDAASEIRNKLPIFNFRHIHHEQTTLPGDSGYHKLARHFGWFLDEMFIRSDYEQVIILEDDLEIAPDFFEYFDATAPLLWQDSTIYCISAWNDNGQSEHVADAKRLFRSDFFPGLGWMLTKTLWQEIGSSWPQAYWDDWLRHPDRRKDRVCIRPEVARSYTFGEKGTSNSQFFGQFLKGIQKNEQFTPFTQMDLSYLKKEAFDSYWKDTIEKAQEIRNVEDLPENDPNAYKIYYDNRRGRIPFLRLAMKLHIMQDEKAGVYRTAYMGVVAVRHHGTQLYIVPRIGPSFDYETIF